MIRIKKICKREYLRGFIDGGANGNKNYTMEDLEKQYKKYLKFNNLVLKEIQSCLLNSPN